MSRCDRVQIAVLLPTGSGTVPLQAALSFLPPPQGRGSAAVSHSAINSLMMALINNSGGHFYIWLPPRLAEEPLRKDGRKDGWTD